MNAEIPDAEDLNLPQALLLLATNDKDGGPAVPHVVLTAALSGAILAELELLGAIELHGKHVRATGTSPQTDFGNQLELIRDGSRPHAPKRWVSMLESRAELRRIYAGLATLGIVDQVGERHLGLFRRTRYPEKDHAPEAALLEMVGAVLRGGSADPRARALTALLYSAELLGKIFPGVDQGHARELANNYWPSRAVAAELRMIRLAEAEAST
jgi:hypothetical protein